MKKNQPYKAATIVLVILVCIFAVFPFIWMISTSFKPPQEIYSIPTLIPKNPTLEGYKDMLFSDSKNFNIKTWAVNSVIVSTATTLFSLIIACLGGYGLSRFRFRGRALLGYVILMTQVLPGSLLIIPLYVLLNTLGLLNTHAALVLAYTTFSVPFCTWMMKGFFDTIPRSLDEAANVDGCGKFRAFFTVVLPLATPGLVATGIFSFIAGWNEYLFASIFVQRYSMWTLPVGISTAVGQYSTNWASVMAGAVMITLPVVILFLLLQKHLVSGMTAGAVKQ
jgi:ABC-type glycerol-3-phosphate transport system permease component